MTEEGLQDFMVNIQMMEEVAAQGALPHGEMPGGLPGNNLEQLDFPEEAVVEAGPASANVREGVPAADSAPPVPGDDDDEADEDEDVEEVGTFMQAYCSLR